jgi:hypothetical protein
MKNLDLAGKVSPLLIAGLLVMAGCGGKGDPGANGSPGGKGTQGNNGASGDAGPLGQQGTNGANGANGTNGANGDAGVSTAPLKLIITNSLTGAAVSGATITLAPAAAGALTTDNSGKISALLPFGDYTLTIAATGYTTAKQDAEVAAGITDALTVKLVPTTNVYVNAGTNLTGLAPGATVSLKGTATPLDGSTGAMYSWAQTSGPTAALADATTASPKLTLPTAAVIKAALLTDLAQPVRLEVLGINPHAIDVATTVVLTLTVTTSSGSYTSTVSVSASAPFQVTTGLRNVPVGIPQLFQAAALPSTATALSWSVNAAGAAGSTQTITDPTTQYPMFMPDAIGMYVLSESATGGSITIYAGTWGGAIGGFSATDGLPTPATNCALCHDDKIAPNKWPEWRQSGHAQIFSQNIDDPANHWSVTACASCHTVGYNTLASATNGGFDDMLAGWTPPAGAAGNYANMFTGTDAVKKLAGLANVQCDSCHGPTNSMGHTGNNMLTPDQASRVSLAAEVCGTCHGEPLRHGRYQQWQASKHANVAVAIARADAKVSGDDATTGDNSVNSCGRCHSGEGFVVWQDQSIARGYDFNRLLQGAANNTNGGNATGAELRAMGLTAATVHSQTCATCHDPHAPGNTSGEPNTATVRVMGDIAMLPAGFGAAGLGKGALCATCHNGRNGLHNDTVTTYGSSGVSTPHDSTAAEVLLGQNVYFAAVGQRGGHSFIANACVNCHMELMPPPEEFSYQQTGTNHSFAADLSICTNCHGAFNGGSIQKATTASLSNLATFIGTQGGKAYNGKVFWTRARRIPANAADTTAVYSHAASTGTDLTGYNVKVDLTSNSVVSGVLLEDSSNLQITLASPIQIQWTDGTAPVAASTFIISLTSVRSDVGDGSAPTNTYPVSLTGNLAKAIWNYITLYREGSFGVHNPSFTNLVIGATLSQDLSK